MSCPKGEIRKKAYTTKHGSYVKSTCIMDKGAKGHGKKVIPAFKDSGMLRTRGYDLKKSHEVRVKALNSAIRAGRSPLEVQKHLVAIRTLHKGDETRTHFNKLTKDIEYLQKMRKKQK